jgi:hypothetical protein
MREIETVEKIEEGHGGFRNLATWSVNFWVSRTSVLRDAAGFWAYDVDRIRQFVAAVFPYGTPDCNLKDDVDYDELQAAWEQL